MTVGDRVLTKTTAVAALMQKRDSEKQKLHQLNDRFASYVERVRFLESENRKLLSDLNELRAKWSDESRRIREQYEPELEQARISIDDMTTVKAKSEIRAKRAEYETNDVKRQLEEGLTIAQQDKAKISNLEYLLRANRAELDELKRRQTDTETDILKYKGEVARLGEDLKRLLTDLDRETLQRAKVESEKQTLEEQIPFLNAIHEQEMAELRSLQAGAQIDPVQFYRHELERAIRDIRDDFKDLSDEQKREMEEFYKLKTAELSLLSPRYESLDTPTKTESSQSLKSSIDGGLREYDELKKQYADLILKLGKLEEKLDDTKQKNLLKVDSLEREIIDTRARLQELMDDYNNLINSKNMLEFEINTYRRLLESADGQKSQQAKPQVTPVSPVTSKPSNGEIKVSIHEVSTKTTFQRTAKGPLSISECSPEGKFIILENTDRSKDVNLANWKLKRTIDSSKDIEFKFPKNVQVKAGKKLRIWARGEGQQNLPHDLVNEDITNWGYGKDVVTVILDETGDEKATHLQKVM